MRNGADSEIISALKLIFVFLLNFNSIKIIFDFMPYLQYKLAQLILLNQC
jgi:hypothetical protein